MKRMLDKKELKAKNVFTKQLQPGENFFEIKENGFYVFNIEPNTAVDSLDFVFINATLIATDVDEIVDIIGHGAFDRSIVDIYTQIAPDIETWIVNLSSAPVQPFIIYQNNEGVVYFLRSEDI